MTRHAWSAGLLLLAGGCMPEPDGTAMVPCSPFVTESFKPAEVRHDVETPGSKEAADRVCAVAARVLAANPQVALRPCFSTIGLAREEIFHRGNREVFITEGLVRRCDTDGQLAGLIGLELGKMIAEREAFSDPMTRMPEYRGPNETPVGTDFGGNFGPPDGTHQMELVRLAAEAKRRTMSTLPSPEALARGYMQKAGYNPNELDAVMK